MKKLFFAFGLILCAHFSVFAQTPLPGEVGTETEAGPVEKASSGFDKRAFVGGSMGAFFSGGLEVGELLSGAKGVEVRNIDMESGGSPAGFVMEAFAGYQLTPAWAVEAEIALAVSGSKVESSYSEKKYYTSSEGGKTVTEYDKLKYGGFFSIDAGGVYRFFSSKKSAFILNGKFAVGVLVSDGGLSYETINGWDQSGTNPGAKYQSTRLADPATGFFIKPGFDIGFGGGGVQALINVHAKILPAHFSYKPEAVITDGSNHRNISFASPQWLIPSVTFGIKYFFKNAG